jgi:FtsH-binding integral membrane protein
MNSSGLDFALSYITVFIFAGLTAYDTQKLKSIYFSNNMSYEGQGKAAIMGALSLYLDFINMFVSLLRIIGDRR